MPNNGQMENKSRNEIENDIMGIMIRETCAKFVSIIMKHVHFIDQYQHNTRVLLRLIQALLVLVGKL